MGIFDALFGKKKSEPREPAPTGPSDYPNDEAPERRGPMSWPERRAKAMRSDDFDWEWGNQAAHALAHRALELARPHFGGDAAKIKELPDDEHIDLRGSYEGELVRFAVWMSFGSFWSIEMRVPTFAGIFMIERDHEKVPKHGDPHDPWDEDESRRVFLGKGIFVEDRVGTIDDQLAMWAKLAPESQAFILRELERLDANSIHLGGKSVSLNQKPGLADLDDPPGYMRDCAALLLHFKRACEAAGIEGAMPGAMPSTPASTPAVMRVTCGYCTTAYLAVPGQPNCPNCGAPPQG